jgi:hypothetical protein
MMPSAGAALRRVAAASSSRPHLRAAFAAAAASKDGGDKSWGEIAEEAVTVAKDVASKVGQGVGALFKAVAGATGSNSSAALTPERRAQEEQERRVRAQQKEAEQSLSKMLGGGLLGRVASGVLSSAARSLASTLEAQQREAADVRGAAEAALKASPDLAARLGGAEFEVGPTLSQSSSSVSINGIAEKRVALVVPLVDGRTGRVLATARVDARVPPGSGGRGGGADDGGSGGTRVLDAIPLDMTVTLPTGEAFKVGGGGRRGGGGSGASASAAAAAAAMASSAGGGASRRRGGAAEGEVIDAEFKEL